MKKALLFLVFSLLIQFGFAQVENIDIKTLLDLTNNERAKPCKCGGTKYKPTTKLVWNDSLAKAAKIQAEYLIKKNSITHIGSNGLRVDDRVSKLGYNWHWIGENIAKGQESLEEVMDDWMKSPPHCQNIMNQNFVEYGAAVVVAKNGQLIFVAVFGSKQD